MRFLEKLSERENAFLNRVRQLEGILPLYIWGAGMGGSQVSQLLRNEGISFDGMVVNKKYYQGQEHVLCLEDLLDTVEKINVIIAFKGYEEKLLDRYVNKIENVLDYDCWAGIQGEGQSNYIPYSWLLEHESELQGIYDLLQDEYSRKCFIAFINQKVSMKFGYLSQVKTPYQYFDEDLVKFTDTEIFVDCGAYDGDSAQAFIQALKRRGITTYREIISFEPDLENFQKMTELNIERHRCILKGVSDKEGVLFFSPNDTSGKVVESSDIKIEVDTIDHVVGDGDVTMIKMDIEGAELGALQGAENTIKRCHPLLAVSLYHKKEDLYEIPHYIKEQCPGYQFYIRAYEDTSTELVLYAIHGDE